MSIEAWARFFEDFDVLLTPSMPLAAFGTDVQSPANLTGCPATAVPTGFDEDGLPLGMRVMGPRFSDARVLAVAAAYERVAPWPLR
jgi:aspartyl-tRNA(Asn)/glutamyl-tRNA(Gln) amidotransferase subunit A